MPIVRSEKIYKDSFSYKDNSTKQYYAGIENGDGKYFENDLISTLEKKSVFHHGHGQLINNSSYVLKRFGALYENQEFCDIELIVGQHVHLAHKLILCQSSQVFLVMLRSPMWLESQDRQVYLKEEPECCQFFGQFLRYLYTGVIQLTHRNVLPLLILGDKYLISDLSQICVDYMCEHMVSDMENNRAVSWYRYAKLKQDSQLSEKCRDFIVCNFHKILSTVQFLQMETFELLEFLKSSELVIPDEYTLFSCIKDWVCLRRHENLDPKKLADTVVEVMTWIRFPMIEQNKLLRMQSDPIIEVQEQFFLERISAAIQYHTFPAKVRQAMDWPLRSTFCPDAFKPRHYTDDYWGTTFYIENFQSQPDRSIQKLMFYTAVSPSDADDDASWEWAVDVYPKGIYFPKCLMIGYTQNYVIEETTYETVRLTIMSKSPEYRSVEVVLLITGVQDNIEYTKKVLKRKMIFDADVSVYNINDIVPFNELMDPVSPYLSGEDGDVFKMTLIINPCLDH